MTHRRITSSWLVVPALGAMAWAAAGCSSGTPAADSAAPVTPSAAIADPAHTPIPAPAAVALPTDLADSSVPQELPAVVEAVDPAATNIENALDATVRKTAGEVEGALDGGDSRALGTITPPADAVNLGESVPRDAVKRVSSKVKESVSQVAGQIEQEVKNGLGQLEGQGRQRILSATEGAAKSFDAKVKSATKDATDNGLTKLKSEILKEIGETPKAPTP